MGIVSGRVCPTNHAFAIWPQPSTVGHLATSHALAAVTQQLLEGALSPLTTGGCLVTPYYWRVPCHPLLLEGALSPLTTGGCLVTPYYWRVPCHPLLLEGALSPLTTGGCLVTPYYWRVPCHPLLLEGALSPLTTRSYKKNVDMFQQFCWLELLCR